MEKTELLGLFPEELAEALQGLGLPAFRTKQVFAWLHAEQVLSYDDMTNLPKALREKRREVDQHTDQHLPEQMQQLGLRHGAVRHFGHRRELVVDGGKKVFKPERQAGQPEAQEQKKREQRERLADFLGLGDLALVTCFAQALTGRLLGLFAAGALLREELDVIGQQ